MKKSLSFVSPLLLASTLIVTAPLVQAADEDTLYSVTITNITRGQNFTPILTATHRGGINLFTLGTPASDNLAMIAEGGNIAPLAAELSTRSNVTAITHSEGLLGPGQSVTLTLDGERARRLSLVAMLLPTNDGFFALNGVKLPKGKRSVTYTSPAYDAGSEPNDELCVSIPGPDTICSGEGYSPEVDGEGYVHIHAGIHGIGDLNAADNDWRNPVAQIVVKRLDD
ncbi:spondin domain-containing protein [Sulfuriflexus mobilis]|uniref:spondin domain-containing protein n=1 Tax=Sulfuriflexus mobilis TaxID=1811807 RepID=UPI000F8332DC|nr:spondin domain-containing protein [Sulfuriflexus mobilis]